MNTVEIGMALRNSAEVEKFVNNAISRRWVGEKEVEKECVFYSGNDERFCRATTCEQCNGCKVYRPNHAYTLFMLANACKNRQMEIEALKTELKAARDEAKEMMEAKNYWYGCWKSLSSGNGEA